MSTNGAAAPPIPTSLLPAQVVTISYLLLIWSGANLASLVVLTLLFGRRRTPPTTAFAWLLSTVLFGPMALLAYLASEGPPEGERTRAWRKALGPSLYAVTGNIAGLVLVLLLIQRFFPETTQGAAYIILGMFCADWLCFRPLPRTLSQRQAYFTVLRRTLPISIATTLLLAATLVPLLALLTESVFRGADPGTPIYWTQLVPAATAGALVLFPFCLWRARQEQAAAAPPQFVPE